MNSGRLTLLFASLAFLGLFASTGTAQGAADNPQVVLETNFGNITIELDSAKAPITVANFLKYVDSGHYNGTIFHRVIPGFMIQGGNLDEKNNEKATSSPIKNEGGNGLKNVRGSIAMARTSVADSATDQFFVNLVDNVMLDRDRCADGVGYAVFGKVVDGMDVVDKIAKVPTRQVPRLSEGYPTQPVVIKSVKRKGK